jgi:integral membrane protein (TIGR00529 family)
MLKLAAVFVFIIVLIVRRRNLGVVLLLASAILGLLFGLSAVDILAQAWKTTVDSATLRLLAAVILITMLGELLREVQSLQRLVDSLQQLVSDSRLVLAIVPALIGLLPMPGGAMLSAPMVDEMGTRHGLDPERKTYLNYWFRHVWEYVFPLYPALILAAAMTGITPSRLMAAQAPMTIAAIAAGVLFGLRGVRRAAAERQPDAPGATRWQSLKQLAVSIWPIVLVIVLGLGLGIELALSLGVTIALAAIVFRMRLRALGQIIRLSLSPARVVLVIGIMVFKQMVLGSGAADTLTTTLAAWSIPLAVICTVVPLVIGLLTGLAMSMVGIAFPLLLPLVTGDELMLSYAVLAYVSGFVGILLTPLHICLALTREYFGASWAKLYRLLLPSALVVAAALAIVWFLL